MKLLPRLIITIGAAGIALTLGWVSNAYADWWVEIPGTADATFQSDGDKFILCNYNADYPAFIRYSYIRINGTLQEGQHIRDGYGCQTFDHNFGEGRWVDFQLCNWWRCTDWVGSRT